jgi:predicted outer membrane protein
MIRPPRPVAAATALAAVLLGTIALAASFNAADKNFVDRAFTLNTTTIERAHVAASSADNDVLDYTESVIGDRNAANDQLASVSQSAGYKSPQAPRSEMALQLLAR